MREDALRDTGVAFEEANGGVRAAMTADEARTFLSAYPALAADFEFMKGDMDDVFLAVTGKKLTGGAQ